MKISRRAFLRAGTFAAGGTVMTRPASSEAAPPTGEMRYRILGRTGLKVSEIGFGGYPVRNPEVVRYAMEKGINYFDTSNCYPDASERSIGEALRGRRDQAILVTKWCPHHIGKPATKANFVAQLDASLRRLQTDHVDVLLNHQLGPSDGVTKGTNFGRLQNPELWEAWETVKAAGKARFIGASGHEGNLMEVMNWAADSGKFDMILCRYSFMNYPTEPDLVKKCAAQGVGFVAMKTLAGAKGASLREFQKKTGSFRQAALKWALSNPEISNLVISISSREQVDEYTAVPGIAFSSGDAELLAEYRRLFSSQVCRFGSDCEPACPHNVRIADILRSSMYFHEYREEKHGITEYASIPASQQVSRCVDCPAPCESACPHGLSIKEMLVSAHSYLTVPG